MKKTVFLLGLVLLSGKSYSQNVGIGIATPQQRLHIGGAGQTIRIDGLSGVGTRNVYVNAFGDLTTTPGTPSDVWLTSGNSGLNAATHFLGTTDAVDLVIRTNSLERLRVLSTGNVGIGVSTPAQRLDVNGNVQFSGALMPAGNAGTTGAFLRSQGAGLPPVWSTGLVVQSIYTVESNANLCINTVTFTTYPGASVTLSLTAGQRVVALGQAGIMTDDNCDGTSDVGRVIVDSRIAVNGNDFPNGAWLRTSLDNSVAYVMFNSISLIGEYTVPAAGNYTFEFQARRAGGGAGDNAISGGNNTSALQATMILIIYTP